MKRSTIVYLSGLVVIIALAGCDIMNGAAGLGSLEISFDRGGLASRSIGPSIDLSVDHYAIHGDSDAGGAFDRTTSEAQIVIDGLAAGYWDVTVDAYNATDVHLYTSAERLLVRRGSSLPVIFALEPVSGTGTLAVDVSWPDGSITDPAVESSLVPIAGAAIPLLFVIAGAGASVVNGDVPSGYHTMIVKLKDGAQIAAGAVDLVQIVHGQTTSADLAFTDVNSPGGLDIDIDVTPQFSESLDVSITGGERQTDYGVSTTLAGSVAGDPGNTVFTWYVNGTAVNTGVIEVTLGGQVPGHYRVDLIVVTADGSDGGSATSWIDVAEPVLQ